MKKITTTLLFLMSVQFAIAQVYTNAESVEYDPVNDQWLVSNGSRMITDDGEGNLSFFGTGPANLGLEVLGNTAFVSVQNGIKGYDLTTEAEVMSLNIPGATFLNGMTNDGNNMLYTTEFNSNRIFSVDVSDLNNPTYTEIVSNTEQTPNGIIFDQVNNRLIYATWTNPALIKAVDLDTFTVSDITTTNVAQVDGIDDDSEGNYYISSWNPDRITKYNNNFTSFETVVTPTIDSPADIGYNQNNDILAIPTFSDVIFVDLSSLSVTDFSSESFGFGISSNPINDATYVEFTMETPERLSLNLYDIQGKLIDTLLTENAASGTYKVVLAGLQLQTGVYLLELQVEGKGAKTIKLIVN